MEFISLEICFTLDEKSLFDVFNFLNLSKDSYFKLEHTDTNAELDILVPVKTESEIFSLPRVNRLIWDCSRFINRFSGLVSSKFEFCDE
jgi:hypothetical protein